MSKQSLNLSLEESAIERGRSYSQRHGTSISKLVNDFLEQLPVDEPPEGVELTPTVRRLLGAAKGGPGEEDYRRHLLEKYGR